MTLAVPFFTNAELWEYLGLHLALALLISAAGFIRVYYFVSLGYAFSIAAMAVVTPWLLWGGADAWTLLQCAALLAYGLRLGAFLIHRERRPAFKKEMADAVDRGKRVRGFVKLAIWVSVSVLYVLMFSPALLALLARRTSPGAGPLASQFPGLALMAAGLLLEAWSDHQKSAFKTCQPGRFCDTGLYRLVRCPNYLGEAVFWAGAWVAGISAYVHWAHWAMSLAGFVCIVLVMLGSTRRLELKQDERYGSDPEYQDYTRSVPVLFPFIRVYSFRNLKVRLG
ncbi:MAG: DUF1295 domain-containing protein [Planctomycetota bacterium]|nr:DUF1295 domain-containing protein [Planctomycetota bacterium]